MQNPLDLEVVVDSVAAAVVVVAEAVEALPAPRVTVTVGLASRKINTLL